MTAAIVDHDKRYPYVPEPDRLAYVGDWYPAMRLGVPGQLWERVAEAQRAWLPGMRVRAVDSQSNYNGCTGTVVRDCGAAGVEVRWDSVPHPTLPLVTIHSPAYITPERVR